MFCKYSSTRRIMLLLLMPHLWALLNAFFIHRMTHISAAKWFLNINQLQYVSPTSNACERLFSRAKLIMRPHRRHMDPSTLEAILMLRMNKEMWDKITIQKVLIKDKQDRAAKRMQRNNDSEDDATEITTSFLSVWFVF